MSMLDLFGEADIISIYSRADAVADGTLIDVTDVAQEAGLRYPVALTIAAWGECVAWNDDDTRRKGVPQDEAGRLWDVLWMLAVAIKAKNTHNRRARVNEPEDRVDYQLYVVPRDGAAQRPRLTRLKAVVGPGDDLEPVITVMLPNED